MNETTIILAGLAVLIFILGVITKSLRDVNKTIKKSIDTCDKLDKALGEDRE